MTTHYFTFGRDHHRDGTPLKDRYVSVSAPSGFDHRWLFMEWLGSNEFSSEYTATEFQEYAARYTPTAYADLTLIVTVAAL